MTVEIHSRFETIVKCDYLKVFIHVGVWRGRALFTFVTWGWWYQFNAGNFVKQITRFDCYNLNDRGRMEIDHVFASGAVVGRATTHEWGRSSLRAELGDPKSGQFL